MLNKQEDETIKMILEQFDANKSAIINAWDLIEKIEDFPEVVISCFEKTTFQRMIEKYGVQQIAETSFANIEIPIYKATINNKKVGFVNAPVGAPVCVALFEDLLAFGMKKLILFGTCGVLDHDIDDIAIIIPDSAVRDEGTSYHYAEVSDEIKTNVNTMDRFKTYLNTLEVSYVQGKVWTTDGIYRETVSKMNQRKSEGCIVVDMECASMAAWAQFREVELIHFFYAADKLSEQGWDERSLSNHANLDEKSLISQMAVGFAKYF